MFLLSENQIINCTLCVDKKFADNFILSVWVKKAIRFNSHQIIWKYLLSQKGIWKWLICRRFDHFQIFSFYFLTLSSSLKNCLSKGGCSDVFLLPVILLYNNHLILLWCCVSNQLKNFRKSLYESHILLVSYLPHFLKKSAWWPCLSVVWIVGKSLRFHVSLSLTFWWFHTVLWFGLMMVSFDGVM